MSHRIAIALGATILTFFLLDALVLHLGVALLLARQFATFVEYLAFWR